MINDNGQTVSAVSTLVSSTTLIAGTIGQAAFSRSGASRSLVIPFRNSATHFLASNTWSNNGATFSGSQTQTVGGFQTIIGTTTLAAVQGHTGFFLVGADQANSSLARVIEFDELPTFVPINQYTTNAFTPIVNERWQMTNIVAPEPGTMLGLAAGAGWLLRRRAKK